MTVNELREVLRNLPGHWHVEMAVPGDECPLVQVTKGGRYLALLAKGYEHVAGDAVIWLDTGA